MAQDWWRLAAGGDLSSEDESILAERLRVMHEYRTLKFVSGRALGDMWTLTSWMLQRSEEWGRPAVLSRQLGPQPDGHDQVFDLIPRIAALMESSGSIQFTDEPGVDPPITGFSLWGPRVVYTPTKKKWLGDGDYITAQLDGRSGSDAKNPPAADLPRLLNQPWPVNVVGLPMTMEETLETMAHSRLHFNVCSGVSHMAHSLYGLPLILVQYRLRFSRWHPAQDGPCPWVLAEGTDDCLKKIAERMA